jgi:pimeloyl-ACP methyl ester carboxylesterase
VTVLVYSLLGLAALFALVCVALWVIYVPGTVRMLTASPWLLADRHPPLEGGESCQVPVPEGQIVRGTYLKTSAMRRRGVIAFCHELTSDRRSAGPYLDQLRQDGFDIFTFDFRNHGESDAIPGYRPLHWLTRYELEDVAAVVDYLATRPDADPRGVGLLGISKGGAAALGVAARDPRVRAVVTDGAYASDAVQRHYIRRFSEVLIPWRKVSSNMPQWCFDCVNMWARLVMGLRLRCRFVNIEPLARRVRQPVLMIHGQRDTMIPLAVGRRLRGCLAGPSKLWVVPGARHNGAITVASNEYQRRLTRFFARHLDGRPARVVYRGRVAAMKSWLSAQTSANRAPKRRPVHSTVETG